MAELELSIRYQTTPARVGSMVMAALLPVWGLIIPFCLGLFLALIIQAPGDLPPVIASLVLSALILIPVLAVVVTAFFEDDRLLVSKEGLAFPLRMLSQLGFRRERLWSDLTAVSLKWGGTATFEPDDALVLHFRSDGSARLPLTAVPKADLEQLLLAIDVWGTGAKRAAELSDLHNVLLSENKGIEHLSYTQMWEEELSRRFSATNFVPLEPGRVLQNGRLKIVRQLAFGGLSAIYLAQRDGRDLVVLKEAVVPPSADEHSREKAAELFAREAQFLAKLNHPQIARVEDHFVEGGRNYLLLEYLPGQDLRQLVKQNGRQSEETVLIWANQVCEILQYLHGQEPPIIHRDLTPDNLVLREDGSVILIDFGAANEFVGTATGTLVGKQAYIAPEQFKGKAITQSDFYALGGTLHFLLTGDDPEALSVSHPREHRQELSLAVDDLVARLTSMDADGRPPSAQAIRQILARLMSEPAQLIEQTQ